MVAILGRRLGADPHRRDSVNRGTALAIFAVGALALLASRRASAAPQTYQYEDGSYEYIPARYSAPPIEGGFVGPWEPIYSPQAEPAPGYYPPWDDRPPAPTEPVYVPVEQYDPETGEISITYTPVLPGEFGYPEPAAGATGAIEPVPPWEPGTYMPAPAGPVASLDPDLNVAAFLAMIRATEGTGNQADPYGTVYGYGDVANTSPGSRHPADPALGAARWPGVKLPDSYCAGAGLPPGCVSTAAGAYQIIWPTWRNLGQPDFSPTSQENAAIKLIDGRGALGYVRAGQFDAALRALGNEWASLPYATVGQPKYTVTQVAQLYVQAGGTMLATGYAAGPVTIGVRG